MARYADSRCDIGVAINEAFTFYAHGSVDVILGPCCDYAAAPVARQVTWSDNKSFGQKVNGLKGRQVIGSVGQRVIWIKELTD